MLHITNGDSVAGSLMNSTVPGGKLAFREDLTSGPTPAGLSTDEWLRLRADFLNREHDPGRDCLQELTEQKATLESSPRDQETVLWFAHDLNCQIHLIYVLNLLARVRSGPDQLSLVCIGEFPGINPFVCLGQLTPEKLESLFPVRHKITGMELELAARAWSAYCSTDPTQIQDLLDSDTSALPFLGASLRLHLARFPSRRNGLGLIENWALRQLNAGPDRFAPLFVRFIGEHPLYGLGDAQFWQVLKRLSECAEPLIQLEGVTPGARFESIAWGNVNIDITEAGRQVLDRDKDFIRLNGVDLWLGGVHLQTRINEWRLDDQTGKLVQTVA
jgi:hypothetical protein